MRREASYSGKWGVNSPASRNFAAYNNITTYKGTSSKAPANLSWTRGNMLGGGNLSGKEFEYKYGPDNLRYSKKVGGTETIYYWDGDILMGEKTGNNVTQYIYDASGIVGMIYNKNYFYFEKNLYGDVLKVYNSSGNPVAIFEYDSYGNVISETGSMADRTHFRYRGYYYDEETGFYYLQSRYYDPSICRFISADQYELVGALSDTVGQLNLYAYCNNNPIMHTDPSGTFVSTILGTIIGAIWGAINAVSQGTSVWKGMLVGAATGAATGLFIDIGVATMGGSVAATIGGLTISALGGFAVGVIGDIASQMFVSGLSWADVNRKQALVAGIITAITNLLGVGISFAAAGIGEAIPKNLSIFQKIVASLKPIHTPPGSWFFQAIMSFGLTDLPNLSGYFIKRKGG